MCEQKISMASWNWYEYDDPAKSMAFIKSCGFEAIDLDMNPFYRRSLDTQKLTSLFDNSIEYLREYFLPLKMAAAENGIEIVQSHALWPVYYPGEEERNEHIVRSLEKTIAVVAYLGCKYIVVHPYQSADKEEEKTVNLSFYRKLIPAAKQYGVTICMENLHCSNKVRHFDGPCTDVNEACWYIDTLNAEAEQEVFGFCLDFGHAMLAGRDLCRFIKTLGSRLKVLHIHENNGFGDSHVIPYTQRDRTGYENMVEWEEIMQALKEIGYKGPLSFETFFSLMKMPREVWGEALMLNSAIGRYFRKLITNH